MRQSSIGHSGSNANTTSNSPIEESKKLPEESDAPKLEFPSEKSDKDSPEPSKLDQILSSDKQEEHIPCACWCQGWAEIYVRRPTGDMSWVMRIQNSMQFETSPLDFPVNDITTLYMPTPQATSTNKIQEVSATHGYQDLQADDIRVC